MKQFKREANANLPISETILRFPIVKKRTGLPKSSIYLKISQNEFPAPISLGARSVGWLASEIDAWIEEKIKQRFQPSQQNEVK